MNCATTRSVASFASYTKCCKLCFLHEVLQALLPTRSVAGQLSSDRAPVLQPFLVVLKGRGVVRGVVVTQDFQRLAVPLFSGIDRDDAVRGCVFGSSSGESNFNHRSNLNLFVTTFQAHSERPPVRLLVLNVPPRLRPF